MKTLRGLTRYIKKAERHMAARKRRAKPEAQPPPSTKVTLADKVSVTRSVPHKHEDLYQVPGMKEGETPILDMLRRNERYPFNK